MTNMSCQQNKLANKIVTGDQSTYRDLVSTHMYIHVKRDPNTYQRDLPCVHSPEIWQLCRRDLHTSTENVKYVKRDVYTWKKPWKRTLFALLRTWAKKLWHVAEHCNTLQNTATHCRTLQHTATHCDYFCKYWLQFLETAASNEPKHWTTLDCSTLQQTATTCCNWA